MIKNGKWTILFTGATVSICGSAKFAAFASAKFALRALGPQGIHVAHIIIDGPINTPQQVKSKVFFLRKNKRLVILYLDEPHKDIESFLNSDAVWFILHHFSYQWEVYFILRLLRHAGKYIFNLVQHGHTNLTFALQWRFLK